LKQREGGNEADTLAYPAIIVDYARQRVEALAFQQ